MAIGNATVNGTVYDESTNEILPNTTVVIGFESTVSNENGTYSIDFGVLNENTTIFGLKSGYKLYEASIEVQVWNTTTHDIYMEV